MGPLPELGIAWNCCISKVALNTYGPRRVLASFAWAPTAVLRRDRCCTRCCVEALFNVFSPPLIQDLAMVVFNVFWFWGPKNSGPRADHPC